MTSVIKDALKDFRTRQKIMAALLFILLGFAVIYHGAGFLINRRGDMLAKIKSSSERIASVKRLAWDANNKRTQEKLLNTPLLPHIQNISTIIRSGTMVNIRLVNSNAGKEQVSFRTENLVYAEFIEFLTELEQYDNVQIKSLSLAKRFDNPKRVDVGWDVVAEKR